jgi:hypothetical protein
MFRRLIAPAMLPSFGISIGNKQRKRLEAAGKFPKRVWCSARKHAYVEDEIIAYGEERIRQRDLTGELSPDMDSVVAIRTRRKATARGYNENSRDRQARPQGNSAQRPPAGRL